MIHECKYAEVTRLEPKWQTDEFENTVCAYCHAPKEEVIKRVASAKTAKDA